MKRLISIQLLLLSSALSAGNIIQVINPGNDQDIQPNLQIAVNNASSGDVIILPEGQFVVNKSVVITKFISLKGQGRDKTILYRSENISDALLESSNWNKILKFNIYSKTPSHIVVSGIGFKSKKPGIAKGDGLSRAADTGIEFIKCIDFIVTDCRFEFFGNGAISIIHDDSIVGGLIYKNEFIHNVKGEDGIGLGYGVVIYGSNTKWLRSPRFGTSNFIFVEDNYFEYQRHAIAAGGCALYVFRHNLVKNNTAARTSHAVDSHEARLVSGENYYSSRAVEIYQDSIVNTQFLDETGYVANGTPIVQGKSLTWLTECAIKTRGGEAEIHDNYIEGYQFGVGVIADAVLSTSYPIPYQQGYLSALKFGKNHVGVDSGKADGDNFIWNNNLKEYKAGSTTNKLFHNYSTNYLLIDRDYHLFANTPHTTYTYPHPLRVAEIQTSASHSDVMCNGGNDGTVTLTTTGGSGTYNYSWSPGPTQNTHKANNLTAGTYTVMVYDELGPWDTITVNITEPPVLHPNLVSVSDITRIEDHNGFSIVSPNGGTAPYSYSWSTTPEQTTQAATGLYAGAYQITVTDSSGCSAKDSIRISEPEKITTSISIQKNLRGEAAAAEVTANGGIPPYSYSWAVTPVVQTALITGLNPGKYFVTVSDKYLNTAYDSVSILGEATGITQAKNESIPGLIIYPNPTSGKFFIKNETAIEDPFISVVFYNTQGEAVFSKKVIKGETVVTEAESKLSSGIYYMVADFKEHSYKTKFVVIQ